MGQYYKVCNITKKEFLSSHTFGDGLKLMEFTPSGSGMMTALGILLASGNNRGGGDLHMDPETLKTPEGKLVGSWAGDKIVIAGDYDTEGLYLTKEQIKMYRSKMPAKLKKEYKEEANLAAGIQYSSDYNRKAVMNRQIEDAKEATPNVYAFSKYFYKDISDLALKAMCIDSWLRKSVVNTLAMDTYRKPPSYLAVEVKKRIAAIKREKKSKEKLLDGVRRSIKDY